MQLYRSRPSRFMERQTDRLERLLTPRNAWITLAVLAACTLVFGVALRNVQVDYDFEKFFPRNDPELERYMAFRERFGHDNDFLMFGIRREAGVFDRKLLTRVDSLVADLQRLPLVKKVISPTRLSEPIITPLGAFRSPYLRYWDASLIPLDSARIWNAPHIREFFFAEDAKAMLVVLNAKPGLSKLESDALLADVRGAMAENGFSDVPIAGRIVGQHQYIRTMVQEMLFFLTSSILLLALFLWIGFRSLYGVVVPIAVVGLAILWQVGIMTAMGHPIGILTMLLPTILFVVGMSDVVHILECCMEEVRNGVPKRRAIAVTYREVGLPTFLTAITAAIGFATLGTASIPPLQEFGLFTAAGVLLAFCLAFTMLPALLVLIHPGKLLSIKRKGSPWDHQLPKLFRWSLRNRRQVLLAFGVITVLGMLGASRIKVNNYLLEDLPANDPMKAGFLWFEEHFGGVRPFEMEVNVVDPSGSVWDLGVLREIERVQTYLDTGYAVDGLVSPVTVIKALNKASHGGDRSFYRLPEDQAACDRLAGLSRLAGKGLLNMVVSADGRTARISGRTVDEGGYVHKHKNAALERFITAQVDPRVAQFHQTGMAFLIDRNNETLSLQMMRGMGLAVLLTALIMRWFFRDWRMVLVALIPNLVPLVFTAGVMGWWGIDLNVGTAIIFSISFGIAEDDTIHMLAAFRQHLRQGRSTLYALKRTYLRTGKAITVTSLMLISGFVTLIFSDFASVHHMGVLITLTLAFAFVAELLLLPALVLVLVRGDRRG